MQAATLQAVAEAITDGTDPDWAAIESSVSNESERALIRHLRAAAQIGRFRATLCSTGVSRAFVAPLADLQPSSSWGALRILEKVGSGRYGVVYRAWDPALAREVALKILRQRDHVDAEDARVVEEGRLMARVRHPNVATIFGAQRIEQRTGLWMEFVHGQTLEAELQERGVFDVVSLVSVGTDLCAALDAVHAAGLIHRDVKAQNVLRERSGRVVLGDFGTGRELDGAARAEVAGTPVYLAPEVFANQNATTRSDIYSLGVLLYHLATNVYPVKGRTLADLREAHTKREVTTLRNTRADLPEHVLNAIDRALDPNPQRRFASASDFARALAPVVMRDTQSSKRSIIAGALVAIIIVVALSGVLLRSRFVSRSVPLNARDWVLVTAVENRTGEAVLDGTLGHALQSELSQSAFVNVVPRARVGDVLQLMRKPLNTVLDPATSREVALRDGQIRALVTGRVDKIGASYKLNVDITNPSDGMLLASITEPPVVQDELLHAISRAAIGVRRRLGEGLPPGDANQVPLAKVTTTSLRALHLHAQVATMLDGRGGALAGAPAGEQLLREAIAEDPSFAVGHAALGEAIRMQGRPAEALEHIKHALALSDQVSTIERLRIEAALAIHAELTRDPAERRRWLEHGVTKVEAIRRLQPDCYECLVVLTNLYAQLGRPAPALATRLADLRPKSYEWAARAVTATLWSGDLQTARRYAERGANVPVPIPPMGPQALAPAWMRLFPALEAWLRGDGRSAAAIADRVAAGFAVLPGTVRGAFALQLAYLYLTLGKLNAAEAFASRSQDHNERRTALLRIAIARGEAQQISDVLNREYPSVQEAAGVATGFVLSGRLADAQRAVAVLRGRLDPAATFDDFVEGQIALHEGRLDDALAGIEAHMKSFMPGKGHYVAEILARLLVARGDKDRAIALLESLSTPRVQLVARPGTLAHEWLPVRDRLATVYREVGQHAKADEIDKELSLLLAAADDDHPIKRRLLQRVRLTRAR